MTTDPAAAAACEIDRAHNGTRPLPHEVAAIIRRHYADQEALLRRAVIALRCRLPREGSCYAIPATKADMAIFADAARLGITGDAK